MPQHQETAAEEFRRRFGQSDQETAAQEFQRRFGQPEEDPQKPGFFSSLMKTPGLKTFGSLARGSAGALLGLGQMQASTVAGLAGLARMALPNDEEGTGELDLEPEFLTNIQERALARAQELREQAAFFGPAGRVGSFIGDVGAQGLAIAATGGALKAPGVVRAFGERLGLVKGAGAGLTKLGGAATGLPVGITQAAAGPETSSLGAAGAVVESLFPQSKVGPAITEAAANTALRVGSEIVLDLGLGSLIEGVGSFARARKGGRAAAGPPTPTETAAEEFTRRFKVEDAPPTAVSRQSVARRRAAQEAEEAVVPIGDLAPDVPTIGPEVPRAEVTAAARATPEPPPGIVSLTHADAAPLRERVGLDAVDPTQRQSIVAAWDDALEQELHKGAVEMSQAAAASGRTLTFTEQAAAVQRRIILENELEESLRLSEKASRAGNAEIVQRETLHTTGIIDQIDILTRAEFTIGSTAGRALRARQIAGDRSLNLASNLQQGQKAKGSALTPAEIKTIEVPNTRGKKLEGEVEIELRKATEAAEVQSRALAGIVVESEARSAARGGAGSGEKLLAERADLLAQLSSMGQRLNDVSNVGGEGLYLMGRLAVNTIRSTVLRTGEKVALSNIVDSVLRDLNNPSITVRDVHEALNARNPRAKARARTEVQKQVAELRSQARILTKIDDAEKGVFPPAGSRPPRSREIKALQRQLTSLRNAAYRTGQDSRSIERAVKRINDLQDQLINFKRTVRRGKPTPSSELAGLQEQIRALRQELGVEDRLLILQSQLRTGEFRTPEPRKAPPTSPSLEAKQVALTKARRQVRAEIQALEPETLLGVASKVTDLSRTLKSVADVSTTMRQSFFISTRRPIVAAKAFDKQVRALFSENTVDQIDNAIRQRPQHIVAERAGLFLSDAGSGVQAREEMFRSNWAEQIPVWGEVVKASGRAMSTDLNILRTSAFDMFLDINPNATTEELKAWADVVNILSGRGNLGSFTGAAQNLNLVFFATRFAVSRVQTPFLLLKYWKLPRVRKEIAKELGATVAVGLTTLTLAKLAGLGVGLDPNEPDWGQIRIGNTRIDIWAGVQQPVRLIARVLQAGTNEVGLTGRELTDSEKEIDPLELFERFAAFKVSPFISIPNELIKGETAVGEKRTPSQTAVRAVLPFVVEDILDAATESGLVAAGITAPLVTLGVGVSTFPDSERRVRREMRKLIEEGTPEALEEARQMRLEHNEANPDNPIRTIPPRRRN